MRYRHLLQSCLLVGALALAPGSHAALFTFFGQDTGLGEAVRLPAHPNSDAARASFFSNLVGVGTENFEGFAVGSSAPLVADFGAAGTATLTGAGQIASVPVGTNGFGRYPISGNQYWEASTGFTITFSEPIAAFGFYGVDIGDFGGRVTLTLAGAGAQVIEVPSDINAPGGGVLYFGLIETQTFTSIAFGNTAAGFDIFAFDDFSIGTLQQVRPPQIPEPPGLALLGLALLAAGLRMGSRRRSKGAAN